MPSGSIFTGRKRRGHAVGQEHDRVDRVLVDSALTEQIDRVVGVEIEQAGQDVVGVAQLDDRRARQVDALQVRANGLKDAAANHDAGVRHGRVADAVKEKATGEYDVPGPHQRDTCLRHDSNCEQQGQRENGERAGGSHLPHV